MVGGKRKSMVVFVIKKKTFSLRWIQMFIDHTANAGGTYDQLNTKQHNRPEEDNILLKT